LNLGFGGNGPLLELAILKEYAVHLRPRIVLWFYFEGNDLENLRDERRSSVLSSYLVEGFSQTLIDRQSEITPVLQEFVAHEKESRSAWRRLGDSPAGLILRHTTLRSLVTAILPQFPVLGSPPYREEDPTLLLLFEKVLRHAKATVDSWGGELYFVYLPDSLRYQAGVDHLRLYSRSRVLASVNAARIPVIDFHETVKELQDPATVSWFPGAHYSATGYGLLADRIDSWLKKSQKPGAVSSRNDASYSYKPDGSQKLP
jgi:hypothetical protein